MKKLTGFFVLFAILAVLTGCPNVVTPVPNPEPAPNPEPVVETVATPTIAKVDDTHLSISCSTSGASIYYTTDKSAPSSSSYQYDNLIDTTDNMVINAIAVKSGMNSSAIATYNVKYDTLSDFNISFEPTYTDGKTTIVATNKATTGNSVGATVVYVGGSNVIDNSRAIKVYLTKAGYNDSTIITSDPFNVYKKSNVKVTKINDATAHNLYQIDGTGSNYYLNLGDTTAITNTDDFFTIGNYQYVNSKWINPNTEDVIKAGTYNYSSKGNKVFYGTAGWIFVCKTSSSVILMRYTSSWTDSGTDFNGYNYSNKTITAKEDGTVSFTWID